MVKRAGRAQEEVDLAQRIRRERQRLALSYADLAKAMTDAGCEMDRAAIYRIEKGDPPRKVSAHELMTLGRVLGKSLDDLTTPIDLVDKQRAQDVIANMEKLQRDLTTYVTDALSTQVEWFDLARDDDELTEYAANHLWGGEGDDPSRYAILPFPMDPRFEKYGIDLQEIARAAEHLKHTIVEKSAELTRAVATEGGESDG